MLKSISLLVLLFLFIVSSSNSQQYDGVHIEDRLIDYNNIIYQPGSVFIYDYEIITGGERYKLRYNSGMLKNAQFEFLACGSEEIDVDRIHLVVLGVTDAERSNDNQTQIYYIQDPEFSSLSSTGLVENDQNIWMHPIRKGFFNALETAPFPYVKLPLEIGVTWTDQMLIGEGWGNEMWGEWKGSLLQDYTYEISDKVILETSTGDTECYKITSTCVSELGVTRLTSYFSPSCGFVRLEYELHNNLHVNFWLAEAQSGLEFNSVNTFFQSGEYIVR